MAKKKSKKNINKELIKAEVKKAELLPKRKHLKYSASMDNIIVEAIFEKGAEEDKNGEYVQPYMRSVKEYIIKSVGPLVKSNTVHRNLKIGKKIVPMASNAVVKLEMDEYGFSGSIKPHQILAVVE